MRTRENKICLRQPDCYASNSAANLVRNRQDGNQRSAYASSDLRKVSTLYNGQSPEMQLRDLRDYCRSRGWQTAREYVDIGQSGAKDSRPELNHLMADAHQRKFMLCSPGRIERDLAECAEKEAWRPATYNRHRALVSGIFSLAIRNGKATANPVRGTRHRIENNARVRYLTEEEGQRLVKQVRATCPELEPQIVVALHSGMRRSEQYVTPDCPDGGLKWQHIDFRSAVITLPRSKHGESRHIKMNSLLRETLTDLKKIARSPYVFPVELPDKLFPEICRQAKVTDFTWHCLRHTFASRLVMAGVDLRTVQDLMGHKSIVTTMRYAHLAPQHQADAVERPVTSTSTAISTKGQGRQRRQSSKAA